LAYVIENAAAYEPLRFCICKDVCECNCDCNCDDDDAKSTVSLSVFPFDEFSEGDLHQDSDFIPDLVLVCSNGECASDSGESFFNGDLASLGAFLANDTSPLSPLLSPASTPCLPVDQFSLGDTFSCAFPLNDDICRDLLEGGTYGIET
jgi:hypothetical protein